MALPIALAVASTAISFFGAMSAAKAAKREAAMQQRMIKQEKQRAALRALQEHNARLTGLDTILSTNIALSGVSGRDASQDRSFAAIQKRAKTEIGVETDRAYLQSLSEQAKLSAQSAMAMEKGRNISRAYQYQAFGTLFSGAMQTQKLIGTSTIPVRGTGLGKVGYST